MSVNGSHDDITYTPGRLEPRLAVLREEYDAGQAQLRALDQRVRDLQNTMMRISGAITVLEEMLGEDRAKQP